MLMTQKFFLQKICKDNFLQLSKSTSFSYETGSDVLWLDGITPTYVQSQTKEDNSNSYL